MISFDEWALPTLDIELADHTYKIPGPTVADEPIVRAVVVARYAAIVGEPLPDAVAKAMASAGERSLANLVLGSDVVAQMEADRVPARTVNRVSAYAADYWIHGAAYADTIARALYGKREADTDPKAQTTKPTRARRTRTPGSARPRSTASAA